jgi:hypothetical protein
VHWAPFFGPEWLLRIADSRSAEALPAGPELSALAQRYDARYLVASSSRQPAGPILYSNPDFSVYRIVSPSLDPARRRK